MRGKKKVQMSLFTKFSPILALRLWLFVIVPWTMYKYPHDNVLIQHVGCFK